MGSENVLCLELENFLIKDVKSNCTTIFQIDFTLQQIFLSFCCCVGNYVKLQSSSVQSKNQKINVMPLISGRSFFFAALYCSCLGFNTLLASRTRDRKKETINCCHGKKDIFSKMCVVYIIQRQQNCFP